MAITWLNVQFQLPPAALHFAHAHSSKQPPLSGQDLGSLFHLMIRFPISWLASLPSPLAFRNQMSVLEWQHFNSFFRKNWNYLLRIHIWVLCLRHCSPSNFSCVPQALSNSQPLLLYLFLPIHIHAGIHRNTHVYISRQPAESLSCFSYVRVFRAAHWDWITYRARPWRRLRLLPPAVMSCLSSFFSHR